MTQGAKTILIVLAAVAGIAALYVAPKESSTKKVKSEDAATMAATSGFNFDSFVAGAKARLQPGDIVKLEKFTVFTAPADYDSAAAIWDNAGLPGIGASFFEKKAKTDNTEKSYLNAAYRYFDGFKMARDSMERAYFVDKSIENYKKVIELNPDNLNAKTDLGVCYAEGTSNPMQGIALLREVIQKDPNHENAQLNLGFLSVKSGQYEKALERFNTVLKNNPARIDAYVFMGQTYIQMGLKNKAIESFETFKSLSDNDKAIKEIDSYLKELKGTP